MRKLRVGNCSGFYGDRLTAMREMLEGGELDVLTGSAGHFCRLVTQRLHRADTDLVATGADVDRWLDIAQAFAGQPGEGRSPK